MVTVGEILLDKGSSVWSISPDASVLDALKEMADKNVGALVVLEGDKLVGIISERDYARKVSLKSKTSRETPVREIMNDQVWTVTPQQTVEECMQLMTEQHIRHLPVINNRRLAGIVSIGDIVRAIIEDQAFLIGQYDKYISGTA